MLNWLCVYRLPGVTATLVMPQTFMATERLTRENSNWKDAWFFQPPRPVMQAPTPQGEIKFDVDRLELRNYY